MSRPTVEITRLSNGLTIATDHMPKLESAALGIWVCLLYTSPSPRDS